VLTRKLIVAHAGGKSAAHPNTVEAFAHAIRAGADMIEFDVRRTADHHLVVHHDDTLGELALATTPLDRLQAEALARGYHIPRLTEVLALARGRVMLDVELKEPGYEDAVLRALHDHGCRGPDLIVTSFTPEALGRIKTVDAAVRTGLLVEQDVTWSAAVELLEHVAADVLAPDHRIIEGAALESIASGTIAVLPWTVNDAAVIQRLLRLPNVIGVITDDVQSALRLRGVV
jgi:glycerophosphoryl diester phosphodiesterase